MLKVMTLLWPGVRSPVNLIELLYSGQVLLVGKEILGIDALAVQEGHVGFTAACY